MLRGFPPDELELELELELDEALLELDEELLELALALDDELELPVGFGELPPQAAKPELSRVIAQSAERRDK